MGLCFCLGVVILALHTYIARTFPRNPKASQATPAAQQARHQTPAQSAASRRVRLDLESSVSGLNYCALPHGAAEVGSAAAEAAEVAAAADRASESAWRAQQQQWQQQRARREQQQRKQSDAAGVGRKGKGKGTGMGLQAAWDFLRRSPQMRCLAVMALAQGITTNLLELCWKTHLHRLHTTPAAYAAFLGDVAMWTGLVTGAWGRQGWRGLGWSG
jgi:AAA family ATP:ADP antiporter